MKIKLLSVSAFAAMAMSSAALAAPPKAAAPASADAAAPQPIAAPNFGAAIPGQCYINQTAIIGYSNMGRTAQDRLVQIRAMVDAELQPEGEGLQKEYEGLLAQQKSLTPSTKPQWEAKAKAFSDKQQAFEQKVQLRQEEMQRTSQGVMSAIFQNSIPYINQVVTARGCSTVMTVDGLLQYDVTSQAANGQVQQSTFVYVNPAMDITKDVITKMDSSGVTLPAFNRVEIKPQQAAAAPK